MKGKKNNKGDKKRKIANCKTSEDDVVPVCIHKR
jgi:hypothetical protein